MGRPAAREGGSTPRRLRAWPAPGPRLDAELSRPIRRLARRLQPHAAAPGGDATGGSDLSPHPTPHWLDALVGIRPTASSTDRAARTPGSAPASTSCEAPVAPGTCCCVSARVSRTWLPGIPSVMTRPARCWPTPGCR
ncbi:EspF repeat-containing protein [Brachybacterium sp. FME24]|uniref:EspF repeat-containing protein n=1 Tax=Brachybacterium sp. FME24 TaxID=2742605 RepID=UPI0018696B1D